MQKVLFLFLFSFYSVSGQDSLPTIKATSSSVDIRVGDDYFIKGGWYLEPDKKPDVFSIGSKWTYESKRVSFITDIDSISFDVRPGGKYDFIIVLNETVPCHIQIVTSPDPIFMNGKSLLSIGIGFAIMIFIIYLKRDQVNPRYLLMLGYFIPLLFWITTFVSGHIHGNYNHLKNVISELGAIGGESEAVTSSFFILLAALSVLFSIGFYRASKRLKVSSIPSVLSFSKPVTLAWAAIFPLGNEFHSLTGPLPLLVALASLLSFVLWKRREELFQARLLSLASFFIMALIFLRFVRPFGIVYEGLVQRFFYLGWSLWTITISYFFIKQMITIGKQKGDNERIKIVNSNKS